jgi:Putative zinc-finger
MDHLYIEEHNIADRYLIGQLSAEEQRRFEEHFLDCQRCRSWLEMAHHFRAGLQSAFASEEAESGVYLQSGRAGKPWLSTSRLSRKRQLSLQAAAALLVLSLMTWPILEWRRASSDLTRARQVAAEWQRKYEEGEDARNDLMWEMQARDRRSSVERDQLVAQLERERGLRALQAVRRERASLSQANLSVFALSMARGGDSDLSEPANRIVLSHRSELVIFLLELVSEPELQSHRATISTYDNQKIWRKSNLKPDSNNILMLEFNPRLLKLGDYVLTLESLTAQDSPTIIAQYTFRVLSR